MMASRLALFCEKFIQAGWLVALIVAPLFFDIYSSRVFEPDKIALIRTLALAMGAAWLVLRAERWQPRAPAANDAPRAPIGQRIAGWLRGVATENPLAIPALLLLSAYVLSTILSVSPTVSFFGSYQRLQGLYTFSSYLVIFFLAASLIRTRAQVERALSIALVASFPIAFYGIIQHYFLDPLPWVGDVTTRVASNLGNSIFIGAYLILTIPLALARLLQTTGRAAGTLRTRRALALFAVATVATIATIAAAWGLSFDVGAKGQIEANYTGTLTPDQLNAASGTFTLALVVTCIVFALWWGAAFFLKQRAANFLLIAFYSTLLAVQALALFFSQSRGPLIGIAGGLFAFGLLLALVRGRRMLASGLVGLIVLLMILVALINIPNSPLSALRDLPYVGRLGRVFELEGGTGRVRVLIWQGALQLATPHAPLWSPTTGEDAFNPLRPLVGYGPETMYVAYNRFYPPELGQLESRNATPDRSHNETFDALVTTGLFGFIAENLLFLVIFYFALKWLGLIPSPRARNLFVALWFGGGGLASLLFGAVLGWHFVGVALPGGMMLGFFAYLVAFALRSHAERRFGEGNALAEMTLPLWLIALTALFAAHFIEIHFGIAIVATRLYFWFFAAVFIVLGTRRVALQEDATLPAVEAASATSEAKAIESASARRKRPRANVAATGAPKKQAPRGAREPMRVSAAPLITFAFLVGFALAVMGFDYINTNNLVALGDRALSGADIVVTALTLKNTTAGGMASLSMLWLFLTTLLVGLGIAICEWGHRFRLSARDWSVAVLLFVVLAFAIFSGLIFYHVLLIATPGGGILDALLASVILFTIFMLIVAAMCAVTLLFDDALPSVWVRRTTNWVVAPVLVILAGALIFATNVEPVRADMLYKQAATLTGESNATAIELFQRALTMQPQQDYYLLFLGRAYLDAAKNATDGGAREQALQRAEDALKRARAINPYNTDHSANLARLAQSRGALATNTAAQVEAYRQADEYFAQATRLSPNTAHLYVQHTQALLEYARVLDEQMDAGGAANARAQAQEQLAQALQVDATFCLTYAVRAQAQDNWRGRVGDALKAITLAPRCGDVFYGEGLSVAVNALARAGDAALQAGEGAAFENMLRDAANTSPSLEVFTTLANYYSKAGRISEALAAIDGALANIPASDAATQKRYQDFRFTLMELQKALDAAAASPNDVQAQRAVAQQWLARGQFERALPAFDKVTQLEPDDYAARRTVVLLLIATDALPEATRRIAQVQTTAPDSDQLFWERLGAVLRGVQDGDHAQAIAQLEELAKSADPKDFALVSALRALAEKLKGAG